MSYIIIHGLKGLAVTIETQDIRFWNNYTMKSGQILIEQKMKSILREENEPADDIDYSFAALIGDLRFNNLIDNICLIKDKNFEQQHDIEKILEYDSRIIQLLLFCFWLVKDNAINLYHSYSYNNIRKQIISNTKAVNFTTSKSTSNVSTFSYKEISKAIDFFYKYILKETSRDTLFRSEIEQGNDPFHILSELTDQTTIIPLVQEQIITPDQNLKVFSSYTFNPYNDYDRIIRGIQFISFARSESDPTVKIFFYTLFIEAILSRKNNRQIASSISNRASLLIGRSTSEKNSISKKVKRAYKIRSDFVHGSKMEVENNNVESICEFSSDIDSICRKLFITIQDKHSSILNLETNEEIDDYIKNI